MTAADLEHRCLCTKQLLELAGGGRSSLEAQVLLTEIERCPACSVALGEAGLAIAEEAKDTDAGPRGGHFDFGALVGSIVAGRYRVDRWLGKGGMGEVYEAHDLELGERVALKTIIPEFSQEHVALRRFRREVRLARQIVHPNVCRVLEFGRESQGDTSRYFLTMELLEGETLSAKIRREGALAPEVALQIGIQICAGLDAIHRAGVLHRDVKPGNIMLRPDPRREGGDHLLASLLDFGIARAFGGAVVEEEGDVRLDCPDALHSGAGRNVTTHAAVGTPDYMAPEQLSGGPLSAATDVYALGVVLSEMFTGKRRSDQASIDQRVPVALEEIVTRCLEPDPSKRPRSAELHEALVRSFSRDAVCGQNQPIRAPRDGATSSERQKRYAVLLCGVLVLLVTALPRSSTPIETSSSREDVASVMKLGSVLSLTSSSRDPGRGAVRPEAIPEARPFEHDREHVGSAPVNVATRAGEENRPVVAPEANGGTKSKALPAKRAPLDAIGRCSPPYFYDTEGIKVFRKECL